MIFLKHLLPNAFFLNDKLFLINYFPTKYIVTARKGFKHFECVTGVGFGDRRHLATPLFAAASSGPIRSNPTPSRSSPTISTPSPSFALEELVRALPSLAL